MNNLVVFFLVIGALIYIVFPRDLIPDFLLGWGWIDDLLVLYLLWRYYRRLVRPQRPADRTGQSRAETAEDGRSSAAGQKDGPGRDPHAILGVTPGATKAEIKAAYRHQAGKYHPDKVQHLGKEFQELAEKRFKEIQQAYDLLISSPERHS